MNRKKEDHKEKRIVLCIPGEEKRPEHPVKMCRRCGIPMEASRHSVLCRTCAETELYVKVRDYIRENDVTEFEVATHFRIPLRLVKKWIIEGRIEYKESAHVILNCVKCGKVIQFGKLCRHCERNSRSILEYCEEDIVLRKQVIEDLRTKRDYSAYSS